MAQIPVKNLQIPPFFRSEVLIPEQAGFSGGKNKKNNAEFNPLAWRRASNYASPEPSCNRLDWCVSNI